MVDDNGIAAAFAGEIARQAEAHPPRDAHCGLNIPSAGLLWGARHGIAFNGSRQFRDEMNARRARGGLPPRQRLRAMFVIEIALAMSVLDGAIANIALPTIAAELRTEPASAIWVVNAYQLAVMVSLLPFASLGELRGYRRVFGWVSLCSRSARSPAPCPTRYPRWSHHESSKGSVARAS
jgi:hypothetical protein